MSPETIGILEKSLTDIIKKELSEGKTVSIPGFGNFETVKSDEYIAENDNGRRMLFPPTLSVVFTPASRLKKEIVK